MNKTKYTTISKKQTVGENGGLLVVGGWKKHSEKRPRYFDVINFRLVLKPDR